MIISTLSTDFSSFFVRNDHDRTKIPHTVKIVIDKENLECCGLILAQHSPILLNMMLLNSEIYLDEVSGSKLVVEDCIDLLYGGEVDVDENNIQALLKFGKLYEIKPMVEACIEWITCHLNMINIQKMLKVGFFISSTLQEPDNRVINICKSFMMKAISDEGLKLVDVMDVLGLTGDINNDNETISFLLNKDFLEASQSILPVVTDWINSGDKSALVLTKIDESALHESFLLDKDATRQFVEKLNVHIDSLVAAKLLNKLQCILMERSPINMPINSPITSPINSSIITDPQILILPQILQTVFDKPDSIYYAELLMKKIQENGPIDNFTAKYLWSTINQKTLCYEYVNVLRNTIMDMTDDKVPEVTDLGYPNYKFTEWSSGSIYLKHDLLSSQHKSEVEDQCSWHVQRPYILNCRLLHLQNTAPCYKLDLDEFTKGGKHTHHNWIKHWYLTTLKDGKRVLLSLITNTFEEVLGLLRSVPDDEDALKMHCLEIKQSCSKYKF